MEREIITIVIPTYNCASDLKKTLESLRIQEYTNFECVIVDGLSTDNTIAVAEEYRSIVDFHLVIYSEKDAGIYDAMNKGVQHARGKYIQFLGAGDTLVNSAILMNVASFCCTGKNDVVYGYVTVKDYDGMIIKNKMNLFTTFKYRPICHQAIYAKREWLVRFPFQLEYKYVADQDWIMRTYAKHAKFKYIDLPIAVYNLDGFSSTEQGRREGRKEIMLAKEDAFPLQCKLIQLFKRNIGD